ncbi:J domain-containing protein [Thiocapsa marina]|uniref:Heat shock protein DnaJ domain protein n=1 Tax=Thiocapsa marina 5811 TaxID=768671 RepID=F9U648_9GAMM|nr:J domain-containing protein [Thiocapsa marina]EGV20621.1 heat shock protein DnaJ domain protein [Thiocapsa marina 5811]
MIDDWPRHLARTLVSGIATATLEQQLDALLIWLGNPDNPKVAALDEAIARTGLTRLEAARRAYDILDRLLFARPSGSPEQILGLRDTAGVVAAKQRYRCLIQAYHPDRHPARALVHNERTEQINIAYAAFERGASASGPLSTRQTVRARRGRSPKQVDPYPMGAARVNQSFGARLRRYLGGAESFQVRFFVGLILFCALILASLLYPEPSPHRVASAREVTAMPASEARLDGVERPDASSDNAILRLDAPPTAIAPIRAPNPTPPVLVAALADAGTEAINRPTPDAQVPPPAPLVPPGPWPEPIRAPEPALVPERKAVERLPPAPTPPRLRAVPPPALFDQSRSQVASRPDAPALPIRVAPIRPIPALDSGHALGRSPDSSTHEPLVEVDARMRAPSAASVIPPVAMAKTAEHPTSPAVTERVRRADPPASPAAQAPARSKVSADAPVQPLRKRPSAVEETSSAAAVKTPPVTGRVPGPTSTPRRSPVATSETPEIPGCEPTAGVLDRFRSAYNAGALDRLMALYSANAQENETRGRSGIRQLYVRWFDQTSDRRIVFAGTRIRPEGNGRCGARAGFSVSYRDAQGRKIDRTGTIDILFDGRGADARILRIAY